jgi:hypothetical protein
VKHLIDGDDAEAEVVPLTSVAHPSVSHPRTASTSCSTPRTALIDVCDAQLNELGIHCVCDAQLRLPLQNGVRSSKFCHCRYGIVNLISSQRFD